MIINNIEITELEFYKIIKDCYPIFRNGNNPFILNISEYLEDIETFSNTPTMIDLKNNLAYLHISHEAFNKKIYKTFYNNKETSYDNIQKIILKELEGIEIFISNFVNDIKPIFTILKKTKKIKEFLNKLDIKYSLHEIGNNNIITLNGSGKITGEIYYPKPNEENIPEGKFLIIPTASEEFFIPSLSTMNKQGLIITEKGSKTSHLIINSKEFNFNIILIENASKIFKEKEIITIDLDREKII